MRDIFFDLSVRSVRLNFLRSLLASIGIVIGVVAISSMGMLGTNMQLIVKDQLTTGINTIVITPDVVRAEPGSSASSLVLCEGCPTHIAMSAMVSILIAPFYGTNVAGQMTLSFPDWPPVGKTRHVSVPPMPNVSPKRSSTSLFAFSHAAQAPFPSFAM